MKIAYSSDLHVEFGYYDIKNEDNADILVLAGDICVAESYIQTGCDEFFNQCADEFEHIIYIMGNHEYYHGDVKTSFDKIKNLLSHRKNIHVLNDEYLDIDNFRFICSTLWTDMNQRDPLTDIVIRERMNDFRLIRNGDRLLSPNDCVLMHEASKKFIDSAIHENMFNIVVSHHAPSILSISDDYKDDYHMNGGYKSDLDQWIRDRNIQVWIHGHTHNNVSYQIGNTLVLSNQRGYKGLEKMAEDFKLKSFEIEIGIGIDTGYNDDGWEG